MGEGSALPIDPQHTPTNLKSSSSQPQKTHKPRKPERKKTQVPQPSSSTKNVANELSIRSRVTDWCQEATRDTIAQTRFENVSKLSNDSLLVRGVLELKKIKTTQALEITSLKKRVKKLKKKQRLRTHKLKRLYKVGLIARLDSFEAKQSFGDDASKQRRKINDIDADEDITLVNHQDDAEIFDVSAAVEVNAASIATTVSACFKSWICKLNLGLRSFKECLVLGSISEANMSLTAYADADHAGCQDTRRSTSESAQFLGEKLVGWSSKKKKSTAISST
uniref:Retrovirus-related Pol polyprotein from transposon TNT 1-94 n=1 Tax=Tanacetum cinerariifolium TaxID=118510 RepID=A0A699I1W4_TANCI|nr:retrovirus-related Pol polyprotein from transposon TNT 1-94 [Tanacetum cinerariifolium]